MFSSIFWLPEGKHSHRTEAILTVVPDISTISGKRGVWWRGVGAALQGIHKTVGVLSVCRGERGRCRHRGHRVKWSSNMLFIHGGVKQAGHALPDLHLDVVCQ